MCIRDSQYGEYRDNGIYKDTTEEGYYVLRIKKGKATQTGLLTMTDVKEIKNRNVLKHEKTLAAKEQHMMHLLLQRKALVKPVLLGYKPTKPVTNLISKVTKRKPLLEVHFENDDEYHTVWAVKDPEDVHFITAAFKRIKKAYIGDGHHRSTTIQLLSNTKELGKEAKKYKHFYTAYFPFDQLQICDYNRVVDIGEITSLSEFIIGLSHYFELEILYASAKPQAKHEVTFYIDGKWYLGKWKKKFLAKSKSSTVLLDSALINKHVFEEILGIVDVRDDTRIKYFGGTQPLTKIETSSQKRSIGIGICIYPVSVKELTSIADKKQTLPPKSTWFMPRLKSGVLTKNL